METAKASGTGAYFGEGKFKVQVERVKMNANGFRGKSFIVEFKVLETNNATQREDGTWNGDPIGCTRSYVLKLDKPQAFGDIKNLVFALIGQDPKKVGEPEQNPKAHAEATKLVKAACDANYAAALAKEQGVTLEDVSLEGLSANLETFKKKTQKGNDFTVHNWGPVEA